jgi:uracil-DNA glycosylase
MGKIVLSDVKLLDRFIIAFVFLPKLYCMDVKMEPSWKEVLKNEFTKPYFLEIVTFLKTERAAGKTIYPPGPLIFNAFNQTPFDKVRVVILGQDPYHNPGQAHGLSFSVPNGIKPPPSLVNIYREIQNDTGISMPAEYGNLTRWAEQGVLLLNAILTVRANSRVAIPKSAGWNLRIPSLENIRSERRRCIFIVGQICAGKTRLN